MPSAVPDPAWLEELGEFLRIPSISADPAHADDVRRAADWVCEFVRGCGGEASLVETGGHPLAVGELRASHGAGRAPTVLVYGHVDVQPPGDLAAWESPPFEPTPSGEWLVGRGTADDKGNLYLLLKAVSLLAHEGVLPVNVRVVCDGEEETGGDSIVRYLRDDERGADACLVFDGAMVRRGVPTLHTGTRGIVYYHLRVRTGERDLHSGVFGGAALNALHALLEVLGALTALPAPLRAGTIAPTAEELAAWAELDPGALVLASQGARPRDEEAAADFYLRTFASAAVDVHGIRGGEAELQKTVLPVQAEANVSIRLAPGQDEDEVDAAFRELAALATPAGAELELERWASSPAGLVPADAPAIRLAGDAFERVLGRRPVLVRTGGTLPIVPALCGRGIPVVLSGFDVPEGNIHAANERLLLEYVPLGVAVAREALLAFAAL